MFHLAGCYHSQSTIQALYALRDEIPGLKILGVHFNEPGKKYITYILQDYRLLFRFMSRNMFIPTYVLKY